MAGGGFERRVATPYDNGGENRSPFDSCNQAKNNRKLINSNFLKNF